jgi:hypothetical protein
MEENQSPDGLEAKLIALSQYASGIRILNITTAALQPIPVSTVGAMFDGKRAIVSALCERLGTVENSQFFLNPAIRTDASVINQLDGLELQIQQAIRRKLPNLLNAGFEPFTVVLRRIASRVPATLMLDRAATMRFSSADV